MKTKILILCIAAFMTSSESNSQNNLGVGVRFGDPTGLSLKKYSGSKAFEINIGRTRWLYGNGWYDKHFNDWYDKNKFGYVEYQYLGYGRSSMPFAIQLHYLVHKDFKKSSEDLSGLKWYYGFGGQMRFQRFLYSYRYKLNGDPNWYYAYDTKVTDLDLGVDGVIGLEYTFDEAPISMFLEYDLFLELIDDPFFIWSQGGLGVRFNF